MMKIGHTQTHDLKKSEIVFLETCTWLQVMYSAVSIFTHHDLNRNSLELGFPVRDRDTDSYEQTTGLSEE